MGVMAWYWWAIVTCFCILGKLQRTMDMRFDFGMSFSKGYVTENDCSSPGRCAWQVVSNDFG